MLLVFILFKAQMILSKRNLLPNRITMGERKQNAKPKRNCNKSKMRKTSQKNETTSL